MSESEQNNEARYSIGIDLGTTHSVLSYVDLEASSDQAIALQVMAIPQLIGPGSIGDKDQLPSFLYQPHPDELADSDQVLPWSAQPEALVGEIARQLGSKTPIRLVSSAKSWLCHSGVDCRDAFLPVEAPEEVERISPFQATVRYLEHLRDAWNNQFPDHLLNQQKLTITVPASFDPAARELTAEATRSVGMDHAILLEEPQSALYSWIQRSEGEWRKEVKIGEIILVIDIGGGTTDLSLIAVTDNEGDLELTRVAVGDHILLGGDNMDLAMAYTVKAKLEAEGTRLEPWQVQALTHGCREAKETIFNDPEVNEVPLVVASRGSSLIAGTLRTELTRDEVNRVLVEGFLPHVTASERPRSQPRTGLTTIGLPYAQDAGITRHLGHFLTRQLSSADDLSDFEPVEGATFLHPSAVLFNGGVLKAEPLANRLMEVLNSWLSSEGSEPARLLQGADLDLSVARGAAYFGYVRQGGGMRIRGGTAAAYYIGVESAMPAVPGMPPPLQALCVAPFGMEEGTEETLPPYEFGLVVGEPVRFRFFGSTVRREDVVGARLDYWTEDEVEELSEIEMTLSVEGRKAGEVVPVRLAAAITEVGTLQLEAVAEDSGQRWKVEFDVRAGDSGTAPAAIEGDASAEDVYETLANEAVAAAAAESDSAAPSDEINDQSGDIDEDQAEIEALEEPDADTLQEDTEDEADDEASSDEQSDEEEKSEDSGKSGFRSLFGR